MTAEYDERERYDEYLICQKRGHTPSGFVTAGIPPKQTCRFCGCYFWTETRHREGGAPGAYLTPEQEEQITRMEREGRL